MPRRSGSPIPSHAVRMSPRKISSSNQCFSALARVVLPDNAELLLHHGLLEWDEDVWRSEIAVVLGDLVLEDEVVAKRVPGELAGEAVVLVEILAGMSEDEVGLTYLQPLKDVLDLAAEVGRKSSQNMRTRTSDSAAPARTSPRLRAPKRHAPRAQRVPPTSSPGLGGRGSTRSRSPRPVSMSSHGGRSREPLDGASNASRAEPSI